jgi:hypothetical protein
MTPEEMVKFGIKSFRANKCDCVEFRVFNAEEVLQIMRLMKQYPEVVHRFTAVTIYPHKSFSELRELV